MVFGSLRGKKEEDKQKPGFATCAGATVLVTGSSGLCGSRLVEMLLERGSKKVICFDLAEPVESLKVRFERVQKETKGELLVLSGKDGDLTDPEAVDRAFALGPPDVVYHIAALVGPFHDRSKYVQVNLHGTVNVINACRKYKVPRMVYSNSPSTRFHGRDVAGKREDELEVPDTFLATYAETKYLGEVEVNKACCKDLMTISVAPHQVYGPHDSLFLPKLLETAGTGRLRIFGRGDKLISVCYADNYAHGLMCGADALYEGSQALGKFYIVTDDEPQLFWKIINQAGVAMGFEDLYSKFHLPVWLLFGVAYMANVLGFILNKKFKLNPFNVTMLTIHRYFSIENAKRDLKYEPLFKFEEAWASTIEWFRINWLPGFLEKQGKIPKTKSD